MGRNIKLTFRVQMIGALLGDFRKEGLREHESEIIYLLDWNLASLLFVVLLLPIVQNL